MKYILLNSIMLSALAIALRSRRIRTGARVAAVTCSLLFLLTLIFDNLIIWAGLVAYDSQSILGVRAWLAPIEDFAYSIGAVIIVWIVWEGSGRHAEHP